MTTPIDFCNRVLDTFTPNNKKELAALSLSCASLLFSRKVAVAAGIGYLGYKWITAIDPSEVQTIYTPPHPTQADLLKLRPYAAKIESLKKDPTIMGIVFTPNRQNELTPVYIKSTVDNERSTVTFTVHDLADNTQLGFALTQPFVRANNYLEGFWVCGRPPEYNGYGSSKTEVGKVLLEQVTNESESHKNIGVILYKAINQYFKDECEGRIIIQAVRDTHPYHYKVGFRSLKPEQNYQYSHFVTKHQKPNRNLGSVYMHLPNKARELWLQEIQDHPIGFPN